MVLSSSLVCHSHLQFQILPCPGAHQAPSTPTAGHIYLTPFPLKYIYIATPWTAAYQASLSMGFSRQGYWSGVPLPSFCLSLSLSLSLSLYIYIYIYIYLAALGLSYCSGILSCGMGILFPDEGLNPGPPTLPWESQVLPGSPPWESRVLATGPPGKPSRPTFLWASALITYSALLSPPILLHSVFSGTCWCKAQGWVKPIQQGLLRRAQFSGTDKRLPSPWVGMR